MDMAGLMNRESDRPYRYYAHWGLWHGGTIRTALDALKMHTYTLVTLNMQEPIILLDRIADVYPDMDLSVYSDSLGYRNSHGGTGKGKIIGSIWETGLVQSFIEAYDAFYSAINDAEVIEF